MLVFGVYLAMTGCASKRVGPVASLQQLSLEEVIGAARQAVAAANETGGLVSAALGAADQSSTVEHQAMSHIEAADRAEKRATSAVAELSGDLAAVQRSADVAKSAASEGLDDPTTQELTMAINEAVGAADAIIRTASSGVLLAQTASNNTSEAAKQASLAAKRAAEAANQVVEAAKDARAKAESARSAADQVALEEATVAAEAAQLSAADARAAALRLERTSREAQEHLQRAQAEAARAEEADSAVRALVAEARRETIRAQDAVHEVLVRIELLRSALIRTRETENSVNSHLAAAQSAARNTRIASTLAELAPLMAFASERPGRLGRVTTTLEREGPAWLSASSIRSLSERIEDTSPDMRSSWAADEKKRQLLRAGIFAAEAREAAGQAQAASEGVADLAGDDMPPRVRSPVQNVLEQAEEAHLVATRAQYLASSSEEEEITDLGHLLALLRNENPQDWSEDEVERVIQEALSPAVVLFEQKYRMRVGTADTVTAVIGIGRGEEIRAKLESTGKYVAKDIKASYKMKMTLTEKQEGTFRIAPIDPSDGIRGVTRGFPAPWEWRVTPLHEGTFILNLKVEAVVSYNDKDLPLFIRQLDAEIEVEAIPWGDSLVAWFGTILGKVLDHIETAIAAFLFGVIFWLIRRYTRVSREGDQSDQVVRSAGDPADLGDD